jgi:hypothetical protein
LDLTRTVDIYCERTDASFWSEPANALTNLAFIVAAALIVRTWRAAGPVPADARVLAALVALIGAGSFLFHTFATVWAGWLDVIFILAFIYVFFARFLARVAGWGLKGVALGLLVYWVFSRAVTWPFPPGSFNGSYSYLPPLIALAGLAGWAWRAGHASAGRLAAAAGVFLVSLAFRTFDQSQCAAWPLGTHFIWHCLNAVVLYLAGTALVPRRGFGPPA